MAVIMRPMTFPRTLTLIVSLAGIALLGILWLRVGSDQGTRLVPSYILLSLPFILATIVSLAPMSTRTRIVYLWIVSAGTASAAVLTIFGGVGYFYLLALATYLWSAWQLNESGDQAQNGPDS